MVTFEYIRYSRQFSYYPSKSLQAGMKTEMTFQVEKVEV